MKKPIAVLLLLSACFLPGCETTNENTGMRAGIQEPLERHQQKTFWQSVADFPNAAGRTFIHAADGKIEQTNDSL
jgi:hypothetical protein